MKFEARTNTESPQFAMRRRAFLASLFSAAALGLSDRPSIGAEPTVGEGQSTPAQKSDAIRKIPMQLMTAQAQTKIREVVENTSYFRRMPQRTIECEPELFKQYVRYPELLIGIWDSMGATKVEIERIAPYEFRADDAAGTKCVCELLFGNDSVHVYYATGNYTGKLIPKPIDGRSVCVVHSRPSTSEDGRSLVTAQLDVFLKLDNFGADLVVRTIGPLVSATADQNYLETLKFLTQLSNASLNNPMGVRGLIERVRFVQPEIKEKHIAEIFLAADRESRVASVESSSVPNR